MIKIPRKFKRRSKQSGKLCYALIGQYGNYLASRESFKAPSTYWIDRAKRKIKPMYLEATKQLRPDSAIKSYRDKIKSGLEFVLDKNINKDNMIEMLVDDSDNALREFIDDLSVELGSTESFTLAVELCSQEKMNLFIGYMLDNFLDNEIPLSDKTIKMLQEQEHDKYVYAMLKNKKCAICGTSYGVQFEHWKTVASDFGNYKNDDGTGTYISMCASHHSEKHNIGISKFYNKYKLKGIKISEEQVVKLKKVYPNHFQAFKK